ncbi:uncharacterized protein CEXT_43101 [Caerostris extrusa]|uniref:Uncharacterized protein n=1 Tax=Caerostris extrusa TaxID=172846 RepID=A0AAV4XHM3_CAEEX|nr:uncharacterized protein CEXT_43101 [Caerostris extrusa]
MLCDLLGSQLGSQWKSGLRSEWKIENAANVCKKWSNWKYCQEFYVGSYNEDTKKTNIRWPNKLFPEEQNRFILWFRCLVHQKLIIQLFINGLYAFNCMKYYIEDLQWHQYAVVSVCEELFPDDKELLENCKKHDQDKWDAFL